MINETKVINFLQQYGLDVSKEQNPELLQYIESEASRRNQKTLTYPFMINVLSTFLKVDEAIIKLGFKVDKHLRSNTECETQELLSKRTHRKGSLLHRLGSKEKLKYVLTPTESLSPEARRQFEDDTQGVSVSIGTRLERSPDTEGRRRVTGVNQTPYVELISSTSGTIFRETSRKRSRVEFNPDEINKAVPPVGECPELTIKDGDFKFTITREKILERQNASRDCAQRKLTGYSAEEFFIMLGATILEKLTSHGSHYHLAHIQGFALGGEQNRENLIPSTAGSNYNTLFLLEAPIKALFKRNSTIKTVTVEGCVTLHQDLPLVEHITYHATWGKGREITVKISPLEYAHPTMDDYKVAMGIIHAARTPASEQSSEEPDNESKEDLNPLSSVIRKLF